MQMIEFGPDLPAEQVIESNAVSIRLPEAPKRYYRHGWQSWSLATWTDATRELPISKPYLLHSMQLDPLHGFRRGHPGSWVGAVETGPKEVLLLGSLGLDAHVALDGREFTGGYDAGSGSWFVARGQEKAVFSQYALKLGEILGNRHIQAVPRVWCSWYGLYTAIDEKVLSGIIRRLDDLPFDVLQVDDGWQRAVGDWQANTKFPAGMNGMADMIRSTGRRAGLWLAPLIAARSSQLFREHPEWFLSDEKGQLVSAGFNWGQQLYALDTTQPAVTDWLRELMQQVRAWGYDYIKLDFLYAGALPGRRRADVPREAAYRQALQALREGMGEEAYFVACGAPIIPSLGVCDALRVGPDVAGEWETERDAVLLHNPAIPGTRNAIRTVINRLWLAPLVRLDPDVVYFRSLDCNLTAGQKRMLQNLALICGFKATSDLPQWLSLEEHGQLRSFLEADPQILRLARERFTIATEEVDFSSAMELPASPAGWKAAQSAVFGWLANHRTALWLDHELGKRALMGKVGRLRNGLGKSEHR